MMEDFGLKLRTLFPDWKEGDWILSSANGEYTIEQWNRPEPKPTNQDVSLVTQGQIDSYQKTRKGDDEINKLDDVTKAILNVMATHLGVTPQSLRREVKAELKK